MMAFKPDEIIAGFPHSSLPKVTSEPTFEDLKIIRWLLNTNDFLPTKEAVGIIMAKNEYFVVATDVFPIPSNTGARATIVGLLRHLR
jgi:hypothetical protein